MRDDCGAFLILQETKRPVQIELKGPQKLVPCHGYGKKLVVQTTKILMFIIVLRLRSGLSSNQSLLWVSLSSSSAAVGATRRRSCAASGALGWIEFGFKSVWRRCPWIHIQLEKMIGDTYGGMWIMVDLQMFPLNTQ